MKWLSPIAVLVLLQLTTPDGATLWFSPEDVGPFRSGKGTGMGCENGTIIYGDQSYCIKETPEQLKKKMEEHEKANE
jgi:hypothetical protein